MQLKLKSSVIDVSQDHHLFESMRKDNEIYPEIYPCKMSLVSYLFHISYIFDFFPEYKEL